MNSGSSDKQHTAAGTSRVQAPLDRCAAPGPAAARRFRDDRAPHLMLRALPTWFQEPRVPDGALEPEPPARHALRAAPRAAPRTAPAARATVTDRSTSLATPSRRTRHATAHLNPNPDPLTLSRTLTLTRPTRYPRQVSPSLPALTLQPDMAFGTGEHPTTQP